MSQPPYSQSAAVASPLSAGTTGARSMHDPAIGQWQTPNGRSVTFEYRQDTNDWNTIQSCTAADEYQLRGQRVDGWALDIGAHIGGGALAIFFDNPTPPL